MKRRLSFFLVIYMTMATMPILQAAMTEPAGKIVALRGSATAENNDTVRKLKIKSTVFKNDIIRTSKTGRVQILFTDKTIVSLGISTEMKIAQYFWDKEQQKGALTNEIREGVFRVLGGAITKTSPENFKTQTPVATIGIRGSIYKGKFREGKLAVLFEGGKGIDVVNKAASIPITRPGFGTTVKSRDEKPTPVERFSSKQLSDIDTELDTESTTDSREQESSEKGENSTSERETGGMESEESMTDSEADSGQPTDTSLSDQSETTPLETVDRIGTNDSYPEEQLTGSNTGEPVKYDGMKGAYMSCIENGANDTVEVDKGEIKAVNDNGLINSTILLSDSSEINIKYNIPGFDPGGEYNDFFKVDSEHDFDLFNPGDKIAIKLFSSPLGEFSIFAVPGNDIDENGTVYTYQELGYSGIPSDAAPLDGVSGYIGSVFAVMKDLGESQSMDSHFGGLYMEVNWHAGTYMMHTNEDVNNPGEEDNNPGGPIIFGHMDGTSIKDIYFAGAGSFTEDHSGDPPEPGIISWFDGTLETGEFYGSENQGVGMIGTGEIIEVQNQSNVIAEFDFIGAGMLEVQHPDDVSSPTGTSVWNGFVVGLSDDMGNPHENRSLFLNSSDQDFQLVLDRDEGTVTGFIDAADTFYNAGGIHVNIGPDNQSAYVLDDHFIAYLGDGISVSGDINELKPYGNYMVTAPPIEEGDVNFDMFDTQFSEYVQWGYWEVSYADPGTGKDYHLHNPGSLWIAGELTAENVVNNLIQSDFKGTYKGGAQGASIGPDSFVSELTNGVTELAIDFSPSSNEPVSGTISFDQVTLDVSGSSPVSSSGFTADINGSSSGVNGTFLGPNADAIGGNFQAEIDNSKYFGIFGGDLQP